MSYAVVTTFSRTPSLPGSASVKVLVTKTTKTYWPPTAGRPANTTYWGTGGGVPAFVQTSVSTFWDW